MYLKVQNLDKISSDRLKIRLRNNIIKVEINWPHPINKKTKDKIGPLYEKIQKNAIQVTRKGDIIIITLGKLKRGKWGQLTKEKEKYDEKKIDKRVFNFAKKLRTPSPGYVKNVNFGKSGDKNHSGKSKKNILKSNGKDKRYSHLPFFSNIYDTKSTPNRKQKKKSKKTEELFELENSQNMREISDMEEESFKEPIGRKESKSSLGDLKEEVRTSRSGNLMRGGRINKTNSRNTLKNRDKFKGKIRGKRRHTVTARSGNLGNATSGFSNKKKVQLTYRETKEESYKEEFSLEEEIPRRRPSKSKLEEFELKEGYFAKLRKMKKSPIIESSLTSKDIYSARSVSPQNISRSISNVKDRITKTENTPKNENFSDVSDQFGALSKRSQRRRGGGRKIGDFNRKGNQSGNNYSKNTVKKNNLLTNKNNHKSPQVKNLKKNPKNDIEKNTSYTKKISELKRRNISQNKKKPQEPVKEEDIGYQRIKNCFGILEDEDIIKQVSFYEKMNLADKIGLQRILIDFLVKNLKTEQFLRFDCEKKFQNQLANATRKVSYLEGKLGDDGILKSSKKKKNKVIVYKNN